MKKRAAIKEGLGPLEQGHIVYLKLHNVDRAKLDNPNATMVILGTTEHDNYIIGNKAGVYREKVSRSHLHYVPLATPVLVGLDSVLDAYRAEVLCGVETLPRVGIRKVAAACSVKVGGQGMFHCECKGDCSSNRCSCKKAGRVCNSRCHSHNSKCTNHD